MNWYAKDADVPSMSKLIASATMRCIEYPLLEFLSNTSMQQRTRTTESNEGSPLKLSSYCDSSPDITMSGSLWEPEIADQ